MTSSCILYVEDEANDAFLLQHAFKQAGIANTLHVVSNGQQAFDYLNGVGGFSDRSLYPMPALVILDYKLPNITGLDVLEWIREKPELRKIIVIMYSSSQNSDDIARAYALGVNSYIVKQSALSDIVEMARALKEWWLERNQFTPLPGAPNKT